MSDEENTVKYGLNLKKAIEDKGWSVAEASWN